MNVFRHLAGVALALAWGGSAALAQATDAGPTQIAIVGGVAIASVVGPGIVPLNSRTAPSFGAVLTLPATKDFAFRTGLQYVPKGLSDTAQGLTDRLAIGYVEVPAIGAITVIEGKPLSVHALLGVLLAFKASCHFDLLQPSGTQVFTGECGSTQLGGAFPVKSTDFDVVVGGGVTFQPSGRMGYTAEVGWERSLETIDPSVQPFDVKNKVLLFTVGVSYALSP
jgi:hypothetical protein